MGSVSLFVAVAACFIVSNAALGQGARIPTTESRSLHPAKARAEITVTIRPRMPGAELPRQLTAILADARGRVLDSRPMSGMDRVSFRAAPGDYRLTVEGRGFDPILRTISRHDFQGPPLDIEVRVGSAKQEDETPSIESAVVDLETLAIPKKARRLLDKAQHEESRGKHQRALDLLEKAIGAYPSFHQAYNNQGVIHLRLKRYPEAEAAFREALRIKPNDWMSLKNYSWLMLATHRDTEALTTLTQLAAVQPDDPWTQTFLGEALYRLQRFEESERHFLKALRVDPESAVAHYRMGWLRLSRGETENALRHLRSFLRHNRGMDDSEVRQLVQRLER